MCCRQGSNVDGGDYTTQLDNTHGTGFRELLYRWHPWFGLPVFVHQTIDKAGDVVFRCTLSGSDAARWLEIPAWMFDRAACADEPVFAAAPHVGSSALLVLAGLLADVLKARTASSNALLSGASKTSRDQNRGEDHVRQDKGAPATSAAEPEHTGSAGEVPQMDLLASGQSSGVIGAPAWAELPAEVQGTLTRLMAQLILEHADKSKTAAITEAGHDL